MSTTTVENRVSKHQTPDTSKSLLIHTDEDSIKKTTIDSAWKNFISKQTLAHVDTIHWFSNVCSGFASNDNVHMALLCMRLIPCRQIYNHQHLTKPTNYINISFYRNNHDRSVLFFRIARTDSKPSIGSITSKIINQGSFKALPILFPIMFQLTVHIVNSKIILCQHKQCLIISIKYICRYHFHPPKRQRNYHVGCRPFSWHDCAWW